jgi:hypothetical protein
VAVIERDLNKGICFHSSNPQISYFGHVLTLDCLKEYPTKVKVIKDLRPSTSEIQTSGCMPNYLCRYVSEIYRR